MARRDDPTPWRRWPRYHRDLDGAWLAIEDLRDRVDDLIETDQIAEAIADKTAEKQAEKMSEGTFTMTKWQTWAAVGGLLFTAASTASVLIIYVIHHLL